MLPIIEVKNLSKEYIISHNTQPYYTLRDSLTNLVKKPFEYFSSKNSSSKKEKFMALNDVNFSVMPGEVIGIIGRNGAGKSTLLKILSQITPPTSGSIHLRGRVASLLEVGTGFHQELTGRENIFLNGAILGMKQKEIKSKFDEIVEFAGIEKFLDTPVKRYSSGMYVRLAFAIAAHLEPEILIVDEVLAVGDAEFQKKCLGKMGEVAKGGRTVLFVSHNMSAIRQLCNTGILLNKGIIEKMGPISEVIMAYENQGENWHRSSWVNEDEMEKREEAYIKSIRIENEKGEIKSRFLNTENIFVNFKVVINENNSALKFGFDLVRDDNIVFRTQQIDSSEKNEITKNGEYEFACKIPEKFLNIGEYGLIPQISLHCVKGLTSVVDSVAGFEISLDGSVSNFHVVLNEGNHPGVIFPILDWKKIN